MSQLIANLGGDLGGPVKIQVMPYHHQMSSIVGRIDVRSPDGTTISATLTEAEARALAQSAAALTGDKLAGDP